MGSDEEIDKVRSCDRCSAMFIAVDSRGANYLAQVLLNPGVSDLTGSFRYVLHCEQV